MSEENTLQDLLMNFIQHNNKNMLFLQEQAPEIWKKIVGDFINGKTKNVTMQNGVLYIALTSASLRFELNGRRTNLIKRINDELCAEVIKEIVFL